MTYPCPDTAKSPQPVIPVIQQRPLCDTLLVTLSLPIRGGFFVWELYTKVAKQRRLRGVANAGDDQLAAGLSFLNPNPYTTARASLAGEEVARTRRLSLWRSALMRGVRGGLVVR